MAYSVVGAFRDCLRDRRGPAANADCGVPRQPGPVRSPSPSTGHADPGLDQPARGPTPNELNTRVPVDLTDSAGHHSSTPSAQTRRAITGIAPMLPVGTLSGLYDVSVLATCTGSVSN